MSLDVWLNGAFVPLAEAKVSAFDAGFQHAVGVFETIAARHGRLVHGAAHLARLAESLKTLGLSSRVRTDPLHDAVLATLERNTLREARIRLTITGGDLNLLPRPRQGEEPAGRQMNDPTILIVAQPPTNYPEAFFEEGVLVTIADGRLNPLDPLAGHKTLNYWHRLLALQQAAQAGAAEALWFTISNHLAGGSVSNIFIVKNDEILTPTARGEEERAARGELNAGADESRADDRAGGVPLPSPILPGVTRAALIDLADDLGHRVVRRMISIEDLLSAQEVFLTNSSWHVLPVVRLEGSTIGSGTVGPVTTRLRRALLEQIEQETAGAL